MRVKLYFVILAMLYVSLPLGMVAQQNATLIKEATYVNEVPSLAERMARGEFIEAVDRQQEVNPKRRGANRVVPGKGLPRNGDPLMESSNPADNNRIQGRDPIIVWESASASATPTDPTGAVGPNHYVNSWNSAFRIWDKSGNPLTPAASLSNIFPGEDLGDPIVLYDRYAERYLITQFSNTPNGFLVAISQGPDPVNDGWYTYRYNTGSFPDYPKYSIWSDGYYVTANKDQGSPSTSEVVFAMERDKMLTGDPAAQIVGFPLPGIANSGFYSPIGFNVNGSDLPPAGDAPIVYMQDDAWAGVNADHLKIWKINVDWQNTGNSTISNPQEIPTIPFDGVFDGGSFSNLPQGGGPDLDALQATVMQLAQYRRFGAYNAVVFNFVVDLSGTDDYAGIRWYELRQDNDGDDWYIYQEGTYVQPEGHSAYCGSMAMDELGNIGMGYSVVSIIQVPSIRYTGRMASDELGQMTLEEGILEAGTNWDPSLRYGDYAQLTVDPADDRTFWHTGEYFQGSRKNIVGAFKLAPNFDNDIGVVSVESPNTGTLTNSEVVTVTIRNFGLNDATGFSVSYQIDGGAEVTEAVEGTISTGEDIQHTFATTADLSTVGQTYTITATTLYDDDMDNANDSRSKQVTHLFPNDIGVSGVLSPFSSDELTDAEDVSISISNYGGAEQSDFQVGYILDGGDPVIETASDLLIVGGTVFYTFDQQGDFSSIGEHELITFTMLDTDSDLSNDTAYATIVKNLCQPELNCSVGDGIFYFGLGSIDNESGCGAGSFEDFTNLSTDLLAGSTNDLTITTEYGSQHVRVWIDFNDNFTFELDEIVVDDFVIADGSGGGSYTETTELIIPYTATVGEHRLRAKTNFSAPVPDNACEETNYGETEEYTVNILPAAEVDVALLSINEPNNGSLTDSEAIVVEVLNSGTTDVTDVPISYTINGGSPVNEVISGTLPALETTEFTFSTTADLSAFGSYDIVVELGFDGDEIAENDTLSKSVTNYPPNDLGVSVILSPSTGENLSDTEPIVVTIENFGGVDQSDFEVSFALNGLTITETVTETVPALSTLDFTFGGTADLSAFGGYDFAAWTTLTDDFDATNDTTYKSVVNNVCQPDLNCGAGDGIFYFELGTIANPSDCGDGGFEDYTSLSTDLSLGSTNDLTITTNYGSQYVSVWIDFNDNFIYEPEELVVDNFLIADGQGGGSYTETTQLSIPYTALAGEHLLRARTNFASPVPIDPCEDTFWGETEEYTVFLVPAAEIDVALTAITSPTNGSLTNAESIVVDVINVGTVAVTDIPVSYTINGGAPVNETISGTFEPLETVEYTFATAADLSAFGTYDIQASVSLSGDEIGDNDSQALSVTNYPPNDLGVVAIVSPVSGESLSDSEPIILTIQNFGGVDQTGFDVSFSLDGNVITETVTETVPLLSTLDVFLDATVDLSEFGSYEVQAWTSLTDDFDNSNDTTSATVTNVACQPTANCNLGDGLQYFQLGSIDNPSGCEPDGYGDFTFLSTDLDTGSVNEMTMTTGYGNQFVRVWIDLNDNNLYEMDELMVDNIEMADGQGQGTYTETHSMMVSGDATPGEHLMRVKTNWNSPVPDNACESTSYGETEDYTVSIVAGPVGIVEQSIIGGDLQVIYLPGDQYNIQFKANTINERLILTIHDAQGRKLVQNWVVPSNGLFQYELDMSYAAPGVYLVRIGNDQYGKVKQFIVK
jgi:hypothetical protein